MLSGTLLTILDPMALLANLHSTTYSVAVLSIDQQKTQHTRVYPYTNMTLLISFPYEKEHFSFFEG